MVPRNRLKAFVENTLKRHQKASFVVYHVLLNGRKNPCWTGDADLGLDDIVSSVIETAEGMAEGSPGGGGVKLNLQAYDASDDDKVLGTMWFNSDSTARKDQDYGSELSEPATRDGLLSVLMRFIGDINRQNMGTWGVMFQYLKQLPEIQAQQMEKLGKRNEELASEILRLRQAMMKQASGNKEPS